MAVSPVQGVHNLNEDGALTYWQRDYAAPANRPSLTDVENGDYTVKKYLAGTDAWDPTW